MSRKRKPAEQLPSISSTDLEAVTGGRISIRKGPDPAVIGGIKQLAETVAALGQKMTADNAGKQQQTAQMMQQMMGARGR